jgi:hypothetical protein
MEWLALLPIPVSIVSGGVTPGAVEFTSARNIFALLALLVAAVPLLLVAHNAYASRRSRVRAEGPRLCVIEGGKELPFHAA